MWSPFSKQEKDHNPEYDSLIHELYREMLIVAYAKMNNKADALDVVQEAWLKILTKIDTLKDKEKLFQWAKAIVANTAINMLKRRYSVQLSFIELDQCTSEANEPSVDDRLVWSIVHESMTKLDEETRQILIYKLIYSWKDQEIADKLGLPLGTIKAKIHRGRKRLREILVRIYKWGDEGPHL